MALRSSTVARWTIWRGVRQGGLAPMVRIHWVTATHFMRLLSIPRFWAYLGATRPWLGALPGLMRRSAGIPKWTRSRSICGRDRLRVPCKKASIGLSPPSHRAKSVCNKPFCCRVITCICPYSGRIERKMIVDHGYCSNASNTRDSRPEYTISHRRYLTEASGAVRSEAEHRRLHAVLAGIAVSTSVSHVVRNRRQLFSQVSQHLRFVQAQCLETRRRPRADLQDSHHPLRKGKRKIANDSAPRSVWFQSRASPMSCWP
jgi:hypothetical protein